MKRAALIAALLVCAILSGCVHAVAYRMWQRTDAPGARPLPVLQEGRL